MLSLYYLNLFRYGWGRNAEKVEYPDGVAFSIGEGTSTSSLVLQVWAIQIFRLIEITFRCTT